MHQKCCDCRRDPFLRFFWICLNASAVYIAPWIINHMTLCCSIYILTYPELPIASSEPLLPCWHFEDFKGLVTLDWSTLYDVELMLCLCQLGDSYMFCSIALACQYVNHPLWIYCPEKMIHCTIKPVTNVFSLLSMAAQNEPAHCRLTREFTVVLYFWLNTS